VVGEFLKFARSLTVAVQKNVVGEFLNPDLGPLLGPLLRLLAPVAGAK
jgi:hypothetical protein